MGSSEEPDCACLEYIPGEILVIRWRSEEAQVFGSRVELGEVAGVILLDPISARYRIIERVAVPVGLELRYLQMLGRQEDTLAASLNYLGQRDSATRVLSSGAYPGTYISAQSDGSCVHLLGTPEVDLDRPLLIAVDVDEQHCRRVVEAAIASSKHYGHPNMRFIGIYRDAASTTVGLYDYLSLLADLTNFEQCPDAITMSVDFGLACLRRSGGGRDENPIRGSASVASYSFPVFEVSLSIIMSICRNKVSYFGRLAGVKSEPAIFAAAGNRTSKTTPTLRLAYPALRPEIIAVTHAGGNATQGFGPSKTSDLPLVYDAKPVFAVAETMAHQANAPIDGTSFAAPWAASWYICERIAIGPEKSLQKLFSSPLARIAALQRLSKRIRFRHDNEHATYSPIQLLPDRITALRRQPSSMLDRAASLIGHLNNEFTGFEFALTGSAVPLLLASGATDLPLHVAPSDIDLIYYSADPMCPEKATIISKLAKSLFNPLFQRYEHLSIELSSIDGRVAPLTLMQCVIPAASMVLTSSGLVDTWGGIEDIENGVIRCLQPIGSQKKRNPQAVLEQFALLPSFLVALTVVCRLWLQWADRSAAEPHSPSPDLKLSLSTDIYDAAKIDKATMWTERTFRRIEKLVQLMEEISVITIQPVGHTQLRNCRHSIAALVSVTSDSYKGIGVQPEILSRLAERFMTIELQFSCV